MDSVVYRARTTDQSMVELVDKDQPVPRDFHKLQPFKKGILVEHAFPIAATREWVQDVLEKLAGEEVMSRAGADPNKFHVRVTHLWVDIKDDPVWGAP